MTSLLKVRDFFKFSQRLPSPFLFACFFLSLLACVLLQWLFLKSAPIVNAADGTLETYRWGTTRQLQLLLNLWQQAGLFFLSFFCFVRLEQTQRYLQARNGCALALGAVGASFAAGTFFVGVVDLYYYIAYGRQIVSLHQNPYFHLLKDAASDVIIKQTAPHFLAFPTCYGPTANALFAFLNLISKDNPAALVVTFKSAWLMGYGLLVWLTLVFLKLMQSKAIAIQVFGLYANPLTWWILLGDTHLELWILVAMLAGAVTLKKKAYLLSGVVFAVATSIKITTLACIPLILIFLLGKSEGKRHRPLRNFCIGFVLYCAVIFGLFQGTEVRALVQWVSQGGQLYSLVPYLLKISLSFIEKVWPLAFRNSRTIIEVSSGILLLAGYGAILIHCWRAKITELRQLLAYAGIVLLWVILTAVYFQPWYFYWPFVFFIVIARRVCTIVASIFAITAIELVSAANQPQFAVSFILVALVCVGGQALVKTALLTHAKSNSIPTD